MKKFKNLMLMLALALFFVGAMSITKASATDVNGDENQTTPSASPSPSAAPAATKIEAETQYDIEVIEVSCDEQVYYQVVKSADQKTGLKPANWIKAAKQDDKYYIDFSATANGKDAYFALTTDNTKGDAAEVAVVDSVIKSIKVGLNYKTEEIKTGLADIITTLNVKGVDSADDKPEGTAADYSLQWKRGANGTWAEASNFTQLQWDMLKASNGTLYVAIDGTMKDGKDDVSFRLSKEAKVKIPKSAKAPTVKVDYVKGTVALKNGMQVRVNGQPLWMDIIAYDKASQGTDTFALATADAKTGKKVSTVSIADLVAAIRDSKLIGLSVKDGEEITLTARTAATDKKFPSMEGTMKIVLPKAAPTVPTQAVAFTYTKADTKATPKVAAAYELDFSKLFTLPEGEKYSQYEYMFVADKADGTNLAKQKWTKLPENGKVDLAKSIGKDYKYYKASDESKSSGVVKYEAIKAVYIRLAAVKATKDEAGVFASAYGIAEVAVSEAKAAEPEVTEYTITWNDVDGCTVEVKVGDTAVDKGGKIAKDAEVTVAVTEGYTVTAAAGEDAVTITDGKFTMPAANVTLTITAPTTSEE